jgi:hypothetical protein
MRDPGRRVSPEQQARERREAMMIGQARAQGRSITYTDDDGCEVTVTSQGHAFYNAADWY